MARTPCLFLRSIKGRCSMNTFSSFPHASIQRLYTLLYRTILLFLFAALGVVSVLLPSSAQQHPLWFEHISLAQGLSQSSVYAILQDHKGFLWFGTEDGLNKYDGYTFKTYRHNPSNQSSLSANFAQALYEDRDGTLWIGIENGGLNKFDRRTETFTAYRNIPNDPQSLSHNSVRAICESKTGLLWVGTANGLNAFDRQTGKCVVYDNDPKNNQSLSNNNVRAIFEDKNGIVWIGTAGGLNRFDPNTQTWTRYFHNSDHPNSLSSNNVQAICEDGEGGLYIGTWGGGLNRFDPATGIFRSFQHDRRNPQSLGGDIIRALRQDNEGQLWIATEIGGVSIFNKRTETFTVYRHQPNNPNGLNSNIIRATYQDKAGIMWIGTGGGGLNRYDARARKFTSYHQEANNPLSLSSSMMRAFCEDVNGILWIGTEGGGLNRFDRSTGQFTAYRNDPNNPRSISSDIVRAVIEDHNGTLWVGTAGGGLNAFDRRTGTFTTYINDKNNPNALNNNFVRALYEDANGTLWVGTEGGGLSRFDRVTKQFTAYTNDPNDPQSLSGNIVLSMNEDNQGAFWVGTLDGLNKFDRNTGKCVVYRQNPQNPKGLHSNNIRAIVEDKAGNFWIGTWGGGLHLFDRATGNCTVFREKDGLPNDAVYGIIPDKRGDLWLTTNNGLARFSPQTRTFRVYDASDGLQSNEFNSGAHHAGCSGRLYIGGVEGFSEFYPDSIHDNTFLPPVLITGLKKFNKPVQIGNDLSALAELVLPFEDNFFALEYAALSFTHAEKNQYKYKLEGFDRDWIDAGKRREASYTNLDPGTYTFRVSASNNDGVWNTEGASLRIVILPPWWMTWWFRLAAAVCLVSSGGTWFWMRIRRVHEQNRRLERLVTERTTQLEQSNEHLSVANHEVQQHLQVLSEQSWEIASMNTQLQARNQQLEQLNNEKNEFLSIAAHDLKNPLTSIVLSTDLIQYSHQTMGNDKLLEKVEQIAFTAMRMRDIITDLLDINMIESGTLTLHPSTFDPSELVMDVVKEYEDRAAEKSISLQMRLPEHESFIYADYTKTREILDNLVSNALKYSPNGKNIWVEIKEQTTSTLTHCVNEDNSALKPAPCCLILVKDEGPGLSDEDKARLFQRFARLSAQPTGGEQSTGLGLSIVKKLVEAMDGHVWCESEQGDGATFIVALPIVETTVND